MKKKVFDELSFAAGAWTAIECLVLEYDQPTMAKHIFHVAGIQEDEARAILKSTGYGTEELTRFLDEEVYKKKAKRNPHP